MGISNLMDKLVEKRQQECNHSYQDRCDTPSGIFCGECGMRLKK